MDRKQYSIYKLTSPSGRSYVGFTGQSVATRWRQHVRRAATGAKHPLMAAIRKYGADSFTVDTLRTLGDLDAALRAEIDAIAELENGYNLSPGGEHDYITAHATYRTLLQDPEWRAAYVARLSEAIRSSGRYQASRGKVLAALADWREANPAEAYKVSRRNLRIGVNRRGRKKPKPDEPQRLPRTPKGPAAKLHKKRAARDAAKRHWAEMDPAKRAAIAAKIAATMRAKHAAMSEAEKAAHLAQLAEARKRIDHDVRKDRQQAALVRYWGPERRREFGEKVKARRAADKGNANANV